QAAGRARPDRLPRFEGRGALTGDLVPDRAGPAGDSRDRRLLPGLRRQRLSRGSRRARPRKLRATAARADPDDPLRRRGAEHVRDPHGPQPRPATARSLAALARVAHLAAWPGSWLGPWCSKSNSRPPATESASARRGGQRLLKIV